MKGITTVTNSCVFAVLPNAANNLDDVVPITDYLTEHDYENIAQWSADGNDIELWVYLTREDMDIAELCEVIEGK